MNISRTNIEAELRRHVAEGNLVSWVKGCQPGRRSDPMYTVTTVGGEVLRLATLFEIRALVVGLNSFELAQHRREMAEAVWIEQEAAAREERLAQQRELFALAIHTVECPSCASGVGERCTVKTPNPYAAHPHRSRMDTASAVQVAATTEGARDELEPVAA